MSKSKILRGRNKRTIKKYLKPSIKKYGKSTVKKRVPYKKRRVKSKTYKLVSSKQRKNRIKRTKKKYGGFMNELKDFPLLRSVFCCDDTAVDDDDGANDDALNCAVDDVYDGAAVEEAEALYRATDDAEANMERALVQALVDGGLTVDEARAAIRGYTSTREA